VICTQPSRVPQRADGFVARNRFDMRVIRFDMRVIRFTVSPSPFQAFARAN